MKISLILSLLTWLVVGPVLAEASAEPTPYVTSADVHLAELLPPPPTIDSTVTKAELDALVVLQNTRTKEQSDRAVADNEENVWRFADAINNPHFSSAELPRFTAFFNRIVATEPAVTDPAKDQWNRPRPYLADSRISPLLKKKKSGSYPSGHTTVGTLMGILLSDMLPEQRAVIMARAWDFGHNRLVAGMHYASDVEAGRLAGTAIAAVLQTKPDFVSDFEAAKAELRATLGLK